MVKRPATGRQTGALEGSCEDGRQLLVHRGLSTQVTASARLPRLQRWELVETWLHRRFGRCRSNCNDVSGRKQCR